MADDVFPEEDYYTLLGVRPDGVASVVDLLLSEAVEAAQARARALLVEHASCRSVEVWRGGALVWSLERQPEAAAGPGARHALKFCD